jgi:fumarate reductase subunit D
VAAIAAMPLLMIMFAIDSLMNAMFNPLIVLLAGSLTSLWLLGGQETRPSSPLAQPPSQRPATRLF